MAIATSINAFAAGLGLSMLKSSIILAATLIGIITFCLSFLGVSLDAFTLHFLLIVKN